MQVAANARAHTAKHRHDAEECDGRTGACFVYARFSCILVWREGVLCWVACVPSPRPCVPPMLVCWPPMFVCQLTPCIHGCCCRGYCSLFRCLLCVTSRRCVSGFVGRWHSCCSSWTWDCTGTPELPGAAPGDHENSEFVRQSVSQRTEVVCELIPYVARVAST